MTLWKVLPAVVALSVAPWPAYAADSIGAAVVVVNQVTAAYNRDTRTLTQGDNVHQDEMIEVATDASGELKLNDDTKMALGPGAKLLLDKFVYDGEKTKANIAVNLMKGAFRFVTGVAAKPSYVVRVPQASITVRGTIFDVFVQDNGVSWLLLHEGAVQVCNERGACRVLDEPGKLIRINDDGDVAPPSRWTNLKQKTNFDDAFPFVDKQPPKDSPPVLTRDAILIDIVPPKKKVRDKPKDYGDSDRPKKKRTERASDDTPKKKKKRVARGGGSDYQEQIMDGMGVAIGIAGGIRIGGGGGRKYGGGGGGRPGGNSMPTGRSAR